MSGLRTCRSEHVESRQRPTLAKLVRPCLLRRVAASASDSPSVADANRLKSSARSTVEYAGCAADDVVSGFSRTLRSFEFCILHYDRGAFVSLLRVTPAVRESGPARPRVSCRSGRGPLTPAAIGTVSVMKTTTEKPVASVLSTPSSVSATTQKNW